MGNKTSNEKSRDDLLNDLKRINNITSCNLFLKTTGFIIKFKIDKDVNVFKVIFTSEYIKASLVYFLFYTSIKKKYPIKLI